MTEQNTPVPAPRGGDLPADLANRRERASYIAGVVVGGAVLGIDLALLLWAYVVTH